MWQVVKFLDMVGMGSLSKRSFEFEAFKVMSCQNAQKMHEV